MAKEDDEEFKDSGMDRATNLLESFFKQSSQAKNEHEEQYDGLGQINRNHPSE